MRGVPPVQALSRAVGIWWFGRCMLWAIATGSLVFWMACWWVGTGWQSMLCGAAAVLAAWACARRFDRPLSRRLTWDGTAWSSAAPGSDAVQGRARLMIDLGAWLLVRFDADPLTQPQRLQPLWMPLTRVDNRAAWHGLRVALHAPAAPPEPTRVPHLRQPNE